MKTYLEKLASVVIRNRVVILIVILVITILSIIQLRDLYVYNGLDLWIERSSEEYINYNDFIDKFGNDESIVIVYHSDSLLTNSHLRLNYSLTDSLYAVDGVSRVISLATISLPSNSLTGPRLTHLLPVSVSNPERLKERFLRYKFFQDYLISSDLKTTSFTVLLDSAASEIDILESVGKLAENHLTTNGEYVLYGVIPLKEELYKLSSSESKTFLMISLLLMLLLNFILFNKFKEAVIPLLVALITICWTFGLISIMKVGVNVVISVLPLILVVISIAFSIHFISGLIKSIEVETDMREALIKNFGRVIRSCFYSALTTAIALIAFSQSDILPLVNFGLFSALGVFIAFILTFTLLPIIYSFTGISSKKALFTFLTAERFGRLAAWINRYKRVIYSLCIVILLVSLYGITQLKFNTDQVTYFKKSNTVRMANDKVVRWLSGVLPIEIVFDLDTGIYDNPDRYLAEFLRFENELNSVREVKSWQSPIMILTESGFIENGSVKRRIADFIGAQSDDIMSHFISEDGRSLRFTLRTSWLNDSETLQVIQKIESMLEVTFRKEGIRFHITGKAPVFAHLSKMLVRSQVRSLVIAFSLIMILFILIFRSLKVALLSIIPNILPVISTLGVMGLFKIPIDVATVLIASISLGIAIDDTIHFVGAYREQLSRNTNYQAVIGAFNRVGKPLIATSVLLICGFMVMAFSSYRPIVYMGIFISLNLLLALLYDLILLPAILLFRESSST